MDGNREHELMCAVDRARELLSIINRGHDPDDLYRALRAVQFELDSMAQLLPKPPEQPARDVPRPVQLPML